MATLVVIVLGFVAKPVVVVTADPLLYAEPLAQNTPFVVVILPAVSVAVTLALLNVLVDDVAAVLELLAIAFAVTTPPVVATVLIVPDGLTTIPVGFGLAVVGCGTNAMAPVVASVLIVAPPRSMVLPDKYKLRNLCVVVPRSYATLLVGIRLPVM
jgi:hypothetical protein